MPQSPRSNGINPTALAMIICDHVWREPCDGKVSILGTFTMLNADNFPFRHPVIAIYLALTNGHGQVPIMLRLIDVDEQFPAVFELSTVFVFPNPHMVVEQGLEVPNVPFPRPGEYRMQLLANGELLMERRLHVRSRVKRHEGG